MKRLQICRFDKKLNTEYDEEKMHRSKCGICGMCGSPVYYGYLCDHHYKLMKKYGLS